MASVIVAPDVKMASVSVAPDVEMASVIVAPAVKMETTNETAEDTSEVGATVEPPVVNEQPDRKRRRKQPHPLPVIDLKRVVPSILKTPIRSRLEQARSSRLEKEATARTGPTTQSTRSSERVRVRNAEEAAIATEDQCPRIGNRRKRIRVYTAEQRARKKARARETRAAMTAEQRARKYERDQARRVALRKARLRLAGKDGTSEAPVTPEEMKRAKRNERDRARRAARRQSQLGLPPSQPRLEVEGTTSERGGSISSPTENAPGKQSRLGLPPSRPRLEKEDKTSEWNAPISSPTEHAPALKQSQLGLPPTWPRQEKEGTTSKRDGAISSAAEDATITSRAEPASQGTRSSERVRVHKAEEEALPEERSARKEFDGARLIAVRLPEEQPVSKAGHQKESMLAVRLSELRRALEVERERKRKSGEQRMSDTDLDKTRLLVVRLSEEHCQSEANQEKERVLAVRLSEVQRVLEDHCGADSILGVRLLEVRERGGSTSSPTENAPAGKQSQLGLSRPRLEKEGTTSERDEAISSAAGYAPALKQSQLGLPPRRPRQEKEGATSEKDGAISSAAEDTPREYIVASRAEPASQGTRSSDRVRVRKAEEEAAMATEAEEQRTGINGQVQESRALPEERPAREEFDGARLIAVRLPEDQPVSKAGHQKESMLAVRLSELRRAWEVERERKQKSGEQHVSDLDKTRLLVVRLSEEHCQSEANQEKERVLAVRLSEVQRVLEDHCGADSILGVRLLEVQRVSESDREKESQSATTAEVAGTISNDGAVRKAATAAEDAGTKTNNGVKVRRGKPSRGTITSDGVKVRKVKPLTEEQLLKKRERDREAWRRRYHDRSIKPVFTEEQRARRNERDRQRRARKAALKRAQLGLPPRRPRQKKEGTTSEKDGAISSAADDAPLASRLKAFSRSKRCSDRARVREAEEEGKHQANATEDECPGVNDGAQESSALTEEKRANAKLYFFWPPPQPTSAKGQSPKKALRGEKRRLTEKNSQGKGLPKKIKWPGEPMTDEEFELKLKLIKERYAAKELEMEKSYKEKEAAGVPLTAEEYVLKVKLTKERNAAQQLEIARAFRAKEEAVCVSGEPCGSSEEQPGGSQEGDKEGEDAPMADAQLAANAEQDDCELERQRERTLLVAAEVRRARNAARRVAYKKRQLTEEQLERKRHRDRERIKRINRLLTKEQRALKAERERARRAVMPEERRARRNERERIRRAAKAKMYEERGIKAERFLTEEQRARKSERDKARRRGRSMTDEERARKIERTRKRRAALTGGPPIVRFIRAKTVPLTEEQRARRQELQRARLETRRLEDKSATTRQRVTAELNKEDPTEGGKTRGKPVPPELAEARRLRKLQLKRETRPSRAVSLLTEEQRQSIIEAKLAFRAQLLAPLTEEERERRSKHVEEFLARQAEKQSSKETGHESNAETESDSEDDAELKKNPKKGSTPTESQPFKGQMFLFQELTEDCVELENSKEEGTGIFCHWNAFRYADQATSSTAAARRLLDGVFTTEALAVCSVAQFSLRPCLDPKGSNAIIEQALLWQRRKNLSPEKNEKLIRFSMVYRLSEYRVLDPEDAEKRGKSKDRRKRDASANSDSEDADGAPKQRPRRKYKSAKIKGSTFGHIPTEGSSYEGQMYQCEELTEDCVELQDSKGEGTGVFCNGVEYKIAETRTSATAVARRLMDGVFTSEAMATCSLTGIKARGRAKVRIDRPTLDPKGTKAIIEQALLWQETKNWSQKQTPIMIRTAMSCRVSEIKAMKRAEKPENKGEVAETDESVKTKERERTEERREMEETVKTKEGEKTEEREEMKETVKTKEGEKTEERGKMEETVKTKEGEKTKEREKTQDTVTMETRRSRRNKQ
ncbi:trichohyalin-like isoform X4 [Thrips palmi]|uniref:Trichohyalin-like isoform X4 n=1 Tax=Thrips palmi TaxID=161013 RepID=A0A6P9AGB5_THRPL|nr:trichohyalin-like isoform X4 [Thrips palmi]